VRAVDVVSVLLVGCAACSAPRSGALVSAPSTPLPAPPAPAPPETSAGVTLPVACGKPWNLGVVGGDASVVVVCANDVQRRALEDSASIARSLSPGLDPARDKVCACVARLRAPAFVDLVFTAQPSEGRVTVEARSEDDDDPELGPPFVACVGMVSASFPPLSTDACSGPGKVAFIYPVRLDLAP
jgi:hypothetical protein